MATDSAGWAAAGTMGLGLLAALGKIIYDWRDAANKRKKDEIEGANEEKKIEQTAESKWQDSMLSSVTAGHVTAAQWMEKYAHILETVGGLQTQLAEVKGEVNTLRREVDQLRDEKSAALSALEQMRQKLQLSELLVGERDATIRVQAAEINRLETRCNDLQVALDSFGYMVQAKAGEKSDPALIQVAENNILTALDKGPTTNTKKADT